MLLSNLRIVLPDTVIERGALQLEGATIAAVVEGDTRVAGSRIVDGAGLTAIPGVIDIHCDMLEREIEPRPGAFFPLDMAVHEIDKRLAAAGVTTAYTALSFWDNDKPESVRGEAMVMRVVGEVNRLRPELLTDLRIHARFEVSTPQVTPLLLQLLAANQIQMVSLMDHTPGQGQYRDIEHYIHFISRWRQVGREQIEAELRERLERAGDLMERWAIARDVAALAAEQGLPIASHDDDTLEKIDLVAELGATIAEFPVTLEAAEEARRRGMHVAMGAPNALRGVSHSGNLSAAEAIAAGLVDTLAADYHPATLVQAAFALVERGVVDLPAAVALISAGPAASLGMTDRGRIAPGLCADLVLVETGLRPRIRATIRNGTPIYWDAAMAGRVH
jgi:alpha-D-ribose 1-methylphosphonate 5-triphosphate diphosphatase